MRHSEEQREPEATERETHARWEAKGQVFDSAIGYQTDLNELEGS